MLDASNGLRHLPGSLLEPRDLGHYRSRFLFERGAHGLVVTVRHLAGFVFEIQIAQVLVDVFLALAEIAEPRLFFSGVNFAGIEENVIKSGGGHDGADEKGHRVISLLKASPVSGGMIVATCRPLLRKIVLTVSPASCRLSRWRLALGAGGGGG